MGVGCPGPEQCGEEPAEASRDRVDGHRGGDQPKSSHSPFVRAEYQEWRETRFCSENRHGSGPKAVGDPSLYLMPMDLHLVEKAYGGSEQVGTI